jgi:hypothetical protein
MKNTITRSFGLGDYALKGAQIDGFSMTLHDREHLSTEVKYVPACCDSFTKDQVEELIQRIMEKARYFMEKLHENIKCNVIFVDFEETGFTPDSDMPSIEVRSLENLHVIYSFSVEYYI